MHSPAGEQSSMCRVMVYGPLRLVATVCGGVPTWQFSVRPAVPEYCRYIAADRVPFLM